MTIQRTLTLWLAALAVLFAALAPSVSHALAARTITWSEICTAEGAKLVADPQKQPADPLQHHVKHCPYCATHGGSTTLPPPLPVSFAIIVGHDLYPPLYYRAPATLHSWAAAHPRGPPRVA
ncbi:DUF2946 family protein [Oxalobacteraceae bacterium A2-2]